MLNREGEHSSNSYNVPSVIPRVLSPWRERRAQEVLDHRPFLVGPKIRRVRSFFIKHLIV